MVPSGHREHASSRAQARLKCTQTASDVLVRRWRAPVPALVPPAYRLRTATGQRTAAGRRRAGRRPRLAPDIGVMAAAVAVEHGEQDPPASQPGAGDDRPGAEKVRALCLQTLASNWTAGERDGVAFAYTRPSPDRYRWQWYWDSCFSAIVWRRFEVERSRRELASLLSAARRDGFIGHTVFWEGPLRGVRRLFYNVIDEADLTTATIQPPMLPW